MSEVKTLEHNPVAGSETPLRNELYGTPAQESIVTHATPIAITPISTTAAVPNTTTIGATVGAVTNTATIPPMAMLTSETGEKISTPRTRKTKTKPTHYKVVCISLYTQDIENLEATVAELKRRGHTKANKSQLIRQALRQLDIDKLPPPQQ